MLTMKKTVTITGTCTIDDVIVENYRASIDSDNPEIPNIVTVPVKKDLIIENIATCRENRAAFEDYTYSVYEEMAAENTAEEKAE